MAESPPAKLSVRVLRKWELVCGLLLIVTGFVMPLAVNLKSIPVMTYYRQAMHEDAYALIYAAMSLVIMNIVRALPHYIGVYWVADSLRFEYRGRRIAPLNGAIVILLLVLTYTLIDAVHGIHYDFGLPAILMTGVIILYDRLQYNYVSLTKRTLFITFSLMALQFLDIMPAAGALPVGRGELSRDIKRAAEVLELEADLNSASLVGLLGLLLMALLIFILLRDENKLREASELKEANARIQMEAFQLEVQNRTLKETQYLVHDLKSPLSVVRTLEGVLRLQNDPEPESVQEETYDRMEKAMDQMSLRISQLLTMDQKAVFTVEDLLHDVMAQISIETYAPHVRAETEIPEAALYANQGLLSRALVNLIVNAVQAVPEDREPQVTVSAQRKDRHVVLAVTDNGKGVSPELREKIWTHGVSGKGSSGLGLAFVKTAAERFGGHVEIESEPDHGTTIAVWIPEEEITDDE